MVAAEQGHVSVVQKLLEKGAPWNALDRNGKCAGEYAIKNSHQKVVDILVNAGVRAELLLGALENKKIERGSASNAQYLNNSVEYTNDGEKLMDTESEAVMMEWEKPLMEIHAKLICGEGGKDVLNVGFGMGIIDTEIQKLNPRTHTIIEAHPDVYKKMISDGWDKKQGVKILFGRWQDVIDTAGPFDGIFFDTYGEHYGDLRIFQNKLPKILRPGGIYSFFNGLCPGNIFFHGVACQIVQLELENLGFQTEFHPIPVDSKVKEDTTWEGVKNKYWHMDSYYLPVALFKPQSK
mmetsp:Transcript_21503/g.27467  ORF Transcript_21503/g.27467 Transcript_21503/m.27467 type:complete len:293 (+) Transcript_21503:113-991(+)